MVCAFVTITQSIIEPDRQSVRHSGEILFSDTGESVKATFVLPLSQLPASGDTSALNSLATNAVQQLTGRTVDRVLVSGWYW